MLGERSGKIQNTSDLNPSRSSRVLIVCPNFTRAKTAHRTGARMMLPPVREFGEEAVRHFVATTG